jgi:hypothetical protein
MNQGAAHSRPKVDDEATKSSPPAKTNFLSPLFETKGGNRGGCQKHLLDCGDVFVPQFWGIL